mgnify:CR=1 FL=1
MDRDGFFKKGTCVASDKQGWKRLRRIYFALIKYTVDFYLKFNLNPNEKFIRLNPLNQLNPRSFSTHFTVSPPLSPHFLSTPH